MIPRRRDTALYRLRRRPTGAILARLARIAALPAAILSGGCVLYVVGYIDGAQEYAKREAIANAKAAACNDERATLGAMLRHSILQDGGYVVHLQATSLTALGQYAEQAATAIQRDAAAVSHIARTEQ